MTALGALDTSPPQPEAPRAIAGKAALYDDLVESLTAAEEENEKLRRLIQRLVARLAERHGIAAERALSDVISDMTGVDVPPTAPVPLGQPAVVAARRVRQHRGPGRW